MNSLLSSTFKFKVLFFTDLEQCAGIGYCDQHHAPRTPHPEAMAARLPGRATY